MGHLEDARVNVAKANAGDENAAALAAAHASIAVAESLDSVIELLSDLLRKADQIDSGVMLIANQG